MSSGQSVDNFTYTYDNNSNVTAENNLLNTAYSQTFTYDPLNRLNANTLGGAANQSWTLDSQGNWSSFTSNGTIQTQTANAQDQITSISGSITPTYDANGSAPCKGAGFQREIYPPGKLVVPAGSNRDGNGGNKVDEALDVKSASGGPRADRPQCKVNTVQASKSRSAGADPISVRRRLPSSGPCCLAA